MKNLSILSVLVLLSATLSADAFFFRSHVHRHGVPIQSINVGGLILGEGTPIPGAKPRIEIPRDVADSIGRTAKNLQDARTDLGGLLKKYDLETTSPSGGSATDLKLPPRVLGLTVQQFLDAFK